jgi:hypothetical protein
VPLVLTSGTGYETVRLVTKPCDWLRNRATGYETVRLVSPICDWLQKPATGCETVRLVSEPQYTTCGEASMYFYSKNICSSYILTLIFRHKLPNFSHIYGGKMSDANKNNTPKVAVGDVFF